MKVVILNPIDFHYIGKNILNILLNNFVCVCSIKKKCHTGLNLHEGGRSVIFGWTIYSYRRYVSREQTEVHMQNV